MESLVIVYNFIISDPMNAKSGSASSTSSRISCQQMKLILEKLKTTQNRDSTMENYIGIWQKFNKFLINLDYRPSEWEERVSLFGAHLVDNGVQSSTLKSYVSAIKHILCNDGYHWDQNKVLLATLVRACKLVNDKVITRLPVQFGLLELVLFELERIFDMQPYLESLYKAMYAIAYYGLMRVGELTLSPHTVKAKDIHIAQNKNKILIILYSSKTHGKESVPQQIKVSSNEKAGKHKHFFCPFQLMRNYMAVRGHYCNENEELFIFPDKSAVRASQARGTLREALRRINLDPSLYNFHSMRIGRTLDLRKFGSSLEEIRRAGRWSSNVVYKYLRY